MNPLRACLLALAVFTATTGTTTAQSQTAAPSPYSLGNALPGGGWALRSDYSPGLKWDNAESQRLGVSSNRLYADWFPFASSGFRVVGGLSLNDSQAAGLSQANNTSGAGLGVAPSQLRPKSSTSSTYLGIGYSQNGPTSKGLGFYADMGISLGSMPGDADGGGISPSLYQEGWRTQSNGWLGFRYLPSVSLGLIYRY